MEEENTRPRKRYLSPATLGTTYAQYYDVQGSGNRTLDRLAEAIAQAAAPFGPFTAAMRRDTDQFDVTARFRFTHEQTLETMLQAGAPGAARSAR